MSYIKFQNTKDHYEAKVMPFTTQHGYKAVRIIADPIEPNESGFKYYADDDTVMGDYSEYTHHYEGNAYSVEQDEIEYGSGSDAPLPTSPMIMMQNQIAALSHSVSAVNNSVTTVEEQVSEITPFTIQKTAFIDEMEVSLFTDVKGQISVFSQTREGVSVPCTYTRDGDEITVHFEEPLEEVTEVTVTIQ